VFSIVFVLLASLAPPHHSAMAKPLKVLHVLSSLDQCDGGPVRAVIDLSVACSRLDLDSHILAPGPMALSDNELPPEKIHIAAKAIFRPFRYSHDLRRWLRRNITQFDGVVIHGMWLYPGLAAARESLRAGVPYVCFPHGMLDIYPVIQSGLFRRIKKTLYWATVEQRLFKRAAAIFFTTTRELQNANATFKVPNRQLIVVPYGVAPQKDQVPHPATLSLRQPPNRRIALFLGRVHPKKNVEFLIRAWNLAIALPSDYHLVIAGPGDAKYLARLKRLAASGPCRERIHFAGSVSGQDKAYLFGRAQWFLLPSLQENFGVAVLEAVESGCAIAISNQVYISDHFRPESEILDLSLPTWINFLNKRLGDDGWRAQTAQADREWLRRSLSLTAVNEGWADTLRQVFALTGNSIDAYGPASNADDR
jgi:glycosyltransferase involved in cell wall biosynthesis